MDCQSASHSFMSGLSINQGPASMEPHRIARITGGIDFDGIPDESVWESIDEIRLVMYTPLSGGAPTEKSVIKIAYDVEFLYASARMYYQNPADIRAVGKKRDYASFSPDWFALTLDSFNDKENALVFGTNPNGARIDGTVKNDLLIASDVNFSWNTFWDAKTVMTEDGWTAEIRIPFSSLRFQTENGKTRMGMIIMRSLAVKRETLTWPEVSPKFTYPFWKPSLCQVVEFDGLEPKKPLYISPYVTAGIGQLNKLNEPTIDGLFRIAGDDYLTLKWAQTFETDQENKVLDTSPTRYISRWQRRKETGFAYDFIYLWSGKSFNPGIGFQVKQNYHGPEASIQHGWLPGKESFLRHHKVSLTSRRWWNSDSGDHETTNALLQWDFNTKKGLHGILPPTGTWKIFL